MIERLTVSFGKIMKAEGKIMKAEQRCIVVFAIEVQHDKIVSNGAAHVVPRQTRAQLKLVPETLHGYVYSVGSLLCALLLGVVVYGPAVWAQ